MTQRPVVLVCADEGEGERLARDLAAFADASVPVLTPRSFTFHNAAVASRQWEHQRLEILARLTRGDCPVLVATSRGCFSAPCPRRSLPATAGSSPWARCAS